MRIIIIMIKTLLTLALVTAASSSVKRDEYASSGSGNSQPVYSPAASSGSFSSGGTGGYSPGYGTRDTPSYSGSSQTQYAGDHTAAASSSSASYQAQPASQGNLYYYYYPVQEKPKDAGYQTSSSNQFSSAVSPGFGASSGASGESPQHTGLDQAASGQDLSYSQDISYNGQGMGQDYTAQSGSSYDQLSSLASQLQQYGINANGAFNPSAYASQGYGQSGYDASGGTYSAASSPSATYGQSESSGHYSASAHPSYSPAAAAAASSVYGSQSGSQLAYGHQPGGYSPYPGQHAYGNYASASGPQASYEPAASGYKRYGLSSILMPMLALAGLSLLIPTVTSLGSSGRRRRSTEDSAKESAMTGYVDRLERYYSIYRTAVEKEECMNRIICELGDAMSGVRGKSTMLTVIEKFVPQWMGSKMGVFKNAALSAEYGKCKKYTC